MSTSSPTVDSFKKLVATYERLVKDEAKNHRLFAKTLLLTGLAMILAGLLVTAYYAPLGLLLLIVGTIRAINSVYDFGREDSLKRKMRMIRQEFGDILALSAD